MPRDDAGGLEAHHAAVRALIEGKPLRSRVRGYAPWKPQGKSLALLDQVRAVLREYRGHLPLTVRQIFYRLVGAHGFPKTERAYKNLGELLNRARRAGHVPFEHIRDDGIIVREPPSWDSPAALLRWGVAEADRFRLDRQHGQSVRLFLAVEAGGMVPQVGRVAHEYGVPVLSCGGFDSTTAKHELARMAAAEPAAEILHIGDYDPSGESVFKALAEDVRAFAGRGSFIRFTRLAVTPGQIEELELPTAPPKPTDRRVFGGEATAQAEAIPPDILPGIIRDAIEARQDVSIRDTVLADEQAAREQLRDVLLPVLRSFPGGGDAQG